MVNFELGEKFEKVLFRLVTSVGQSKKKSESSCRIEPQTFRSGA